MKYPGLGFFENPVPKSYLRWPPLRPRRAMEFVRIDAHLCRWGGRASRSIIDFCGTGREAVQGFILELAC